MKIINIRGCNGSGKSTLMRRLLASTDPSDEVEVVFVPVSDHKPIPVTFSQDFIVVGDYFAKVTAPGCDKIRTQAAIKELLEHLLAKYLDTHKAILFEGVLISTIYGPWRDWDKEHGPMTWAFLDTPVERCLERIYQRNGGKEIDEVLVRNKHRGILNVRAKALADQLRVIDLPHDGALQVLREEIWN